MTEALSSMLKQQKALQYKLINRESRSRCNNIRIFGVAEGEEGEDSVLEFAAGPGRHGAEDTTHTQSRWTHTHSR